MSPLEGLESLFAFVQRGGDVLWVIFATTLLLWSLILERFWYFRSEFQREREYMLAVWNARSDHVSWFGQQVRVLMVSQLNERLRSRLPMIKTLVALCPLLGLLGTVTGMISVFDVLAISGGGNARGMAAAVSRATLPTMAGMIAALAGMVMIAPLERRVTGEIHRFERDLADESEATS